MEKEKIKVSETPQTRIKIFMCLLLFKFKASGKGLFKNTIKN